MLERCRLEADGPQQHLPKYKFIFSKVYNGDISSDDTPSGVNFFLYSIYIFSVKKHEIEMKSKGLNSFASLLKLFNKFIKIAYVALFRKLFHDAVKFVHGYKHMPGLTILCHIPFSVVATAARAVNRAQLLFWTEHFQKPLY